MRVDGQQRVQEGDEHRGQRQIQDGRYADGIELQSHFGVRLQAAGAQPDRDRADEVDDQIEDDGDHLADAGSQRRTGNAHSGERADAENQQRVQNDVADRAAHQADHGNVHPAHSLKDLLERHGGHDDDGEHEGNAGVGHAHGDDGLVAGEGAQEPRHDGGADDGNHDAVDQRKHHAVGGGHVGLFFVACAEMQRDQRGSADAEADGNRVDEVLHRVDEGQRRHGLLTDAGDKEAVHDVVQCIDQHRDDHGQGH